jgi:hypothetical protein
VQLFELNLTDFYNLSIFLLCGTPIFTIFGVSLLWLNVSKFMYSFKRDQFTLQISL